MKIKFKAIMIFFILIIIIVSILLICSIFNMRQKIGIMSEQKKSNEYIEKKEDFFDYIQKRNILDESEINDQEICDILGITIEGLNQIETDLKEKYEVSIYELNILKNYILRSDKKAVQEYPIKIEDDISKFYTGIISGMINYFWDREKININVISLYSVEVEDEYGKHTIMICDNERVFSICISCYWLYEDTYIVYSHKSNIITFQDFDSGLVVDAAKPIIYIYPEHETIVNVKLGNPENITCTYPKYDENEGWNVKAKPNGDLQDLKTEKNYYALYWEGMGIKVYDYSNPKEGFIVEGENTTEFLEEKLEILGLNDREKEEFIVYWLPQMEKNKYNYIRFETKDEIDEEMPLEIEPKPDTVIRVLMDWKALDEKIEIEEQKLESVQRNGYTVVEWGGSIIGKNIVK